MLRKLNFSLHITQSVIRQVAAIEGFQGKWRITERLHERHLRELRRVATIESIGSSTRIEGATLSDTEVARLIKGVKVVRFETREEQEVAGYYEVLDLILENHHDLPLTENHIKQLHSILLKHSDKDQHHRGEYKTITNQVVANYPDGRQRTLFRTTDPHLTAKEMSELITWTNEQFVAGEIHDLLLIGLFVYEFLSIHPFQDGNGRLSRLLTTLLLLKRGYAFVQYISFEHIIEERKSDYYRALMAGQQHRYQETEQVDAWMLFFLNCLEMLIQKLEAKYAGWQKQGVYLTPRQREIIALFAQYGSLKISDIADRMPKVTLPTLKKEVQRLTAEGKLAKLGQGKATLYYLSDDTMNDRYEGG